MKSVYKRVSDFLNELKEENNNESILLVSNSWWNNKSNKLVF